MSVAIRAIVWSSLFIGFVLVWLPAQALEWAGVPRPAHAGPLQIAGAVLATAGAALALWCIATFATAGHGTPAPFDPPRRLVVRGPYRFVRNPMYLGAGLALLGAALFLATWVLVAYAAVLLVSVHVFVIAYEEPHLRTAFGADYDNYCRSVGRWWPRLG